MGGGGSGRRCGVGLIRCKRPKRIMRQNPSRPARQPDGAEKHPPGDMSSTVWGVPGPWLRHGLLERMMPIEPLPILSEPEANRPAHEPPKPPDSVIVRYGRMFYIGQFSYDGDQMLSRGMKLVVRTPRGVELAEMLTTPCSESGCPHTISRKQMHAYIERSGGKQFPFAEEGKVLRIASPEDLMEQQHLDSQGPEHLATARAEIKKLDLPMKLIDVELLLGGDRIVFYFMSENRVDFRELVRSLASEFHTRIEMRQIGARDEARIVADFEKCGQHCCCRQFLKVLRPVSMRSAKIQKATLDPGKISGRCGRLMCCLRYEDQTYDELRKQLPNRNTRVTTADGPGRVINTQIITQLVIVELESTRQRAAYPLEELNRPEYDQPDSAEKQTGQAERPSKPRRSETNTSDQQPDQPQAQDQNQNQAKAQGDDQSSQDQSGKKRKRRRRRRKRRRKNSGGSN